MGDRLSRRYDDVAKLYRSSIGPWAMADLGLLKKVVAHKNLFFHSGWARFETAGNLSPGSAGTAPRDSQGRLSNDAREYDFRRIIPIRRTDGDSCRDRGEAGCAGVSRGMERKECISFPERLERNPRVGRDDPPRPVQLADAKGKRILTIPQLASRTIRGSGRPSGRRPKPRRVRGRAGDDELRRRDRPKDARRSRPKGRPRARRGPRRIRG